MLHLTIIDVHPSRLGISVIGYHSEFSRDWSYNVIAHDVLSLFTLTNMAITRHVTITQSAVDYIARNYDWKLEDLPDTWKKG